MPNGNNAGMLGLNFLVDVTPNLKLGAATYGAVTGEYGGLTTFGLTGELQQNLTDSWRVHGGVLLAAGVGQPVITRLVMALCFELMPA